MTRVAKFEVPSLLPFGLSCLSSLLQPCSPVPSSAGSYLSLSLSPVATPSQNSTECHCSYSYWAEIVMEVFSLSTSHVYIPPATRALAIATIVSSVFYYTLLWRIGDAASFAPYFFLVPGSSLFYPWTFLTSAFVESSIIEVRSPARARLPLLCLLACCSSYSPSSSSRQP